MRTATITEGNDVIKLYSCEKFNPNEAEFEGDPMTNWCAECGQCQECHDRNPEWYDACERCGENCCQREMIDDTQRLCPDCYNQQQEKEISNA